MHKPHTHRPRRSSWFVLSLCSLALTACGAPDRTTSHDDTWKSRLDGDPNDDLDLYIAVAEVPPPPDFMLLPPQHYFFPSESQSEMIGLQNRLLMQRQMVWAEVMAALDAMDKIDLKVPNSVSTITDNEGAFYCWKAKDGSAITGDDSMTPSSTSTSPTGDATYSIDENGTVRTSSGDIIADNFSANYRAKAVIDGNAIDVNGSYTFEGFNLGNVGGHLGIDAFSYGYKPDDFTLTVSGFVDVYGAKAFAVSNGNYSYGVGLKGSDSAGHEVGVSVAVGADGSPIGLSFGAKVSIPGLPGDYILRTDIGLKNSSVSFTPLGEEGGLTITSNTNGVFRLDLDANKFYAWLVGTIN